MLVVVGNGQGTAGLGMGKGSQVKVTASLELCSAQVGWLLCRLRARLCTQSASQVARQPQEEDRPRSLPGSSGKMQIPSSGKMPFPSSRRQARTSRPTRRS